MALNRIWRPSPHHSGRSGSVRLIVIHCTEGSTTIESLANWFSNPASKVSSHVGADNHRQGTIAEYVKRDRAAWTQGNANGVAVSVEMCTPAGASAGWSRDYWLSRQGWMLDNTAAWVAEEARAYGIPLTRLSASQAQGGGRGVCGHVDLGSWGGNHSDPGRNFPWDYLLAKASGGKPPTSSPAPPQTGGGTAPKFSATPYFDQRTNSRHPDVKTWQTKMISRGWRSIGTADGIYGPKSEDACRKFQAEKRLAVDGKVGPQTWSVTWTAPVT